MTFQASFRATGWLLALAFAASCLAPATARAGDACQRLVPREDGRLATRIATVACRENALWYAPFIDADGRLASMRVSEAETMKLADGATPAWKRVADYWRGSGLLPRMEQFPGATTCRYASNAGYPAPDCRAFLVDHPWSAAFVSWVMLQAGVPGFPASPSHVDYVRDAYLRPDSSPFRFTDPDTTAPAVGDLLCYVRVVQGVSGFDGLRAFLSGSGGAGLPMHCDVVVAASPGGDGKLYAVGGNVLQGVTLRVLPLNRKGLFWGLPHGDNLACGPDNAAACNLNRQNWAVLLQLKPLQPLPDAPGLPTEPPAQQCCVYCVVGSQVPRCPAGGGSGG